MGHSIGKLLGGCPKRSFGLFWKSFFFSFQKANFQLRVIVGFPGERKITTVRNLPPAPSNTMVFHIRIILGLLCRPTIIVFWLQLFWVKPVHINL